MIRSSRYTYLPVHDFFDLFFSSPSSSAAGWGPPHKYPAHTEIFKQDTSAVAVYFIEQGLVKLSRIDHSGQEVIAALRRRHWIIGAPAVILQKPYSFSNTTVTDCTMRCISAKSFVNLVETDKDFNRQILAMLSQEIFTHVKHAVNLGCLPALDRLKRLLFDIISEMKQPSDQERKIKIELPLKQKELAQIIAVTPEYLSRLIKALESEGVIQRDGNWLKIRDYKSLMSECGM